MVRGGSFWGEEESLEGCWGRRGDDVKGIREKLI